MGVALHELILGSPRIWGAIVGAFAVTDGRRGTFEGQDNASRTYEAHASTSTTSFGAGGWIPAGDSRAHQGSQDIRGHHDVEYLSWGWQVDSCRW